jgi:crotonobetainyl-CoA:carnitine CoA-transferase CaiB-like acyl-CoA transferase
MLLKGIRVVDLTRIVSGPFCTAILGDLGAEVVKVESPGTGDPVRAQGERRDGLSWYFANFNRNKKSVSINLHSPEGIALLARLIATADVLVDNFRPGVLSQIGFPAERLQSLRPGIIHCNINGFGTSGPYAERPAFDFVVQAMSGFMSLNGFAAGPPLRTGAPLADLVAGLYGAIGILGALARRGASGEGATVTVSMLSSMVSLLGFHAANYLASGAEQPRTGNDHLLVAPYGLFATADGVVAIAPSTETVYRKLVAALGLDAELGSGLYSDNAARVRDREAVNAIIESRTRGEPTAHWVKTLNDAGVPCGPVNSLADVFADPQVATEEMVTEAPGPGASRARVLGFPIKVEGAPCAVHRPVPACGEHTEAILSELGVTRAELASLRGRAII